MQQKVAAQQIERKQAEFDSWGSVEILRELHVRRMIPRDEGPPEVADSTVY
jgi:hypothetical protein